MKKHNDFQLEYAFEDVLILFQKKNKLMVNATALAKKYDKLPAGYLRLERTQKLIRAIRDNIVGYADSHNQTENLDIVFTSDRHKGTYMHRLLALDFAGWLNPDFQVWMLQKIEYILYGYAQRQNQEIFDNAGRQKRMAELQKKLDENSDYQEIMKLKTEINQANRRISKGIRHQTALLLQDEEKDKSN